MPRRDISEIAEILEDEDFMSQLKEITKAGKKVKPHVEKASRVKGEGTETLLQKVEGRCMFARMGFAMASICGSPLSDKGFVPATTPPIANGMTHCVNEVIRILVDDYQPGRTTEFYKLVALLRRIRNLLRVFYDWKVTRKVTADLKFCDFAQMFDVSFTLHQAGLYLQLDQPRLRALMAAGGEDLEKFLLDEQLDIGQWRKVATKLEKEVKEDEEADDGDREEVGNISELASDDLAAHMLVWFIADINVAFLLNDPLTEKEKRWAQKAADRLVKWSTSATWRDVLGDPLTDSMRPIYWSEQALVKISHAGGLGALYGDWVASSCSDLCADALLSMPDLVWENQSESSLRAITRELQNRISRESKKAATDSIFVNACYNIYKRYGLSPFHAAAKSEDWHTTVLFYFVAHRIKKDDLVMQVRQDWRKLLEEFVKLPRSVERRYDWANLTISGKWDCLEFYGCDYKACPEKQALFKLREKRVKGVRNAVMEERLDRWGAKSKSCSGCSRAAYCSTECQKAHWTMHKADCRKNGKGKKAVVVGTGDID